jgi:hypothetical protein
LYHLVTTYADVTRRLRQVIAWLEAYDCPTPESAELRAWYLGVLTAMWGQVPSGPPAHLVAAYTAEYQRLEAMLAQPEPQPRRRPKRRPTYV